MQDQYVSDYRLATSKQIGFIRSLAAQRVLNTEQEQWVADKVGDSLTARKASAVIDRLLKLPCKPEPEAADVPEGGYAIRGADGVVKFYHVDKPTEGKWAGRVFVNARASDERFPIRNPETKRAILAEIARDPKAAAELFGLELGECSICHRTLTDEESRARGIGPVCAAKRGW